MGKLQELIPVPTPSPSDSPLWDLSHKKCLYGIGHSSTQLPVKKGKNSNQNCDLSLVKLKKIHNTNTKVIIKKWPQGVTPSMSPIKKTLKNIFNSDSKPKPTIKNIWKNTYVKSLKRWQWKPQLWPSQHRANAIVTEPNISQPKKEKLKVSPTQTQNFVAQNSWTSINYSYGWIT